MLKKYMIEIDLCVIDSYIMAIIRHTIPVTTNAASNLSTEEKKKRFTNITSIFFQYKNNNNDETQFN
jgi:hypothetical protein